MTLSRKLRDLGLFDARAPRYTSYPPANHFSDAVGPATVSRWLAAVPEGGKVSLYLHIPYCRRLCWFCACRTQGTATNRPLVPYLAQLKAELAIVSGLLPKNVIVSQVHLGGGTPTILPPEMLRELGGMLRDFRPMADDLQFSVEIDPTEVDAARIAALREIGMTRASVGVQDFDPQVQDAIGRAQSYAETRDVVNMLRDAGVTSLNMDVLYGLPFQNKARMADSVQRVLSLHPDRVALYGYAHVPWMAKRQVMIPSGELPDAETRLQLFDTARRLFVWDGYQEVGIDHYAKPEDSMARAALDGTLKRNFQGYTVDPTDVLIGLGASAISRYPQGFAQNLSTSSRYAAAVDAGQLATERGHAMSGEDTVRARLIEDLMCRFSIDFQDVAQATGVSRDRLWAMTEPLRTRFAEHLQIDAERLTLTEGSRLIARLAAAELDTFHMPEGRHSKAM